MSKPKLTDKDFERAAKKLGCGIAEIKAVYEVESKGAGFYPDGFPTILFERHKFWKNAPKDKREAWFKKYPHICNPSATPKGGYGTKADQRAKFSQAFKLDQDAAMEACSWGLFQELGENYQDYGFKTVSEFVDKMKESEAGQLEIFVKSIIKRGLQDELRDHDWAGFARNYNGAGYKKFNYDVQMHDAYKRHLNDKTIPPLASEPATRPAVSLPANTTESVIDESHESETNETPAVVSSESAANEGAENIGGEPEPARLSPENGGDGQNKVQTNDAPAPPQDADVVVVQNKAEEDKPESLFDKLQQKVEWVNGKVFAGLTAVGTALGGVWAWFVNLPPYVVASFFASTGVTLSIYLISYMWLKNRREERFAHEAADQRALQAAREERAHEITKLQIESAMRKDLNTVKVIPKALESSDSAP